LSRHAAAAPTGERRIEYMPLDELLAWPANAKDHDVGLIDTAMKRFGFIDPIVICERAQRIASGHGRQKTLYGMMLGSEPVPEGIRVREDGMWLAPVVRGWASKNDRELDAATVALNKTTMAGGWLDDKLKDILVAVAMGTDQGLLGIGFDAQDVEDLVANLDKQRGSNLSPPLPTAPWVRPGDLFALGDHRVLCGNSTQRADFHTLLRGELVDCLLTDPPYCSGGFQEADRVTGSIGTLKKDYTGQTPAVANDVLSTRGYRALISSVLELWNAKLAYVFTDWRMWTNLGDVLESQGFGVRTMIVWDKGRPGMGRGWLSQHELIACGTRVKSPFPPKPVRGNVITCDRSGNDHHPTEKPLDLLREILQNTALDIGKTIGDPFLGSGSTLLACEALGRTCYGMDLSAYYVQVAIERWQTFTGKTAEKLEAGDGLDAGVHVAHGARRVRAAQPMKRNARPEKKRKA
jgi:DNA modification methylase